MGNYQGVATLEVLEWAKNYNSWIADKIRSHITFPALEIGAGTGNITRLIVSGQSLTLSDADNKLVKQLKSTFRGKKNIQCVIYDVTKNPSPKLQKQFATVYAINVLEHIEDDVTALKNIKKTLKSKGKVVLLVPAKQFAYSKLDKQLGHYRRYEKQELIDKLKSAGYAIEQIEFFNIAGLASWMLRNKIERNHYQLRPYQIKLFEKLVPVFRRIESVIPVPLGISLIAVAKRK